MYLHGPSHISNAFLYIIMSLYEETKIQKTLINIIKPLVLIYKSSPEHQIIFVNL